MDLSSKELLNKLQNMGEYKFEELIADLWEKFGWNTKVTSGSHDRGVDVVAERKWPVYQKHLIQVKRYSSNNTVGSQDIQQYSSLKQQKNRVDSVIIVTTSDFSKPAKEVADNLNVKTMNKDRLVNIIEKLDFDKSLNDHLRDQNSINNVQKISSSIQRSEEKSSFTQYVEVNKSNIGNENYLVFYPELFGNYNVLMFCDSISDVNYQLAKKKIKKITYKDEDIRVLLENNNRIYIYEKTNYILDKAGIKTLINKFLEGVFSVSIQDVNLAHKEYSGKF